MWMFIFQYVLITSIILPYSPQLALPLSVCDLCVLHPFAFVRGMLALVCLFRCFHDVDKLTSYIFLTIIVHSTLSLYFLKSFALLLYSEFGITHWTFAGP